jgi:hypothetical protein
MSTSQNGWSVINSAALDKSPVPGTDIVLVPGVRAGSVATILKYVAAEFHKRVQHIKNPGCWGYANRPIVGGKDTSNHASGTAIDLNAPQHPMGKIGTFNQDQVNTIHAIVRECGGVVRWGGDYSGRKDEMHFEIIGSSAEVDRVAALLTTQPVTGTRQKITNGQTWNVRAEPTLDKRNITGTARVGDEYEVLEVTGDFCKVMWAEKVRYISKKAFTPGVASAPAAHIERVGGSGKQYYVRRDPVVANNNAVGVVKSGETYETEVVAGGWRYINGKGYVGPKAW